MYDNYDYYDHAMDAILNTSNLDRNAAEYALQYVLDGLDWSEMEKFTPYVTMIKESEVEEWAEENPYDAIFEDVALNGNAIVVAEAPLYIY